ncbi:MAG: hypothetical protein JNL74_12375, partial [Fibrobacteres bacterium]|nr:hypothetical protein [Fibrobacterota bacterium]
SSGDFSWKNPANWSDSVLPAENDTVIFDGDYQQHCVLDTSVTIGGYIAMPDYRRTFDFNGNRLTIKTLADFRGDSTVHANGGLLEFAGDVQQFFYPDSGDTFPSIRQNGLGSTLVQKYSFKSEGDLQMISGSFDLGTSALNVSFKKIRGTGGNIAFNNGTLTVTGDTADFRDIAVIQGTGTLQFSGAGIRQYFYPRAGGWMYKLTINGVNDTVVMLQNDLWLSNNLVLTSGNLKLGNVLNHTVAAVTSAAAASLDFGSSILTSRGNTYMEALSNVEPGTGTLVLAGGNNTRFRAGSSLIFNSIIRNGTGTLFFDSSITCKRLSVNYGRLHLAGTANKIHNVLVDLSGPGELQFGSATLKFHGQVLDLSPLSRIIPNNGKLAFVSDSTDQLFTPKKDSLHPVVSHTGIKNLIISSNNLNSMGFVQTAGSGSTDLNGMDLIIPAGGYVDITDTTEATPPFINLGGRRISVGGPVTFNGKDSSSYINLTASSPWYLSVNGVLTAQYAKIGNSIADSSEGTALNSIDSGGNTRWVFNVRTWDGEAGDSLWSNPLNWSGNTLPVTGEVVRFISSALPCSLDVDADVKSLLFDSSYTGNFHWSDKMLTITSDADFRSGGVFAGKATVRFNGTGFQSFFPSASIAFKSVIQNGVGQTRVYQRGFRAETLTVDNGVFNLSTGLTDTLGTLKGNGTLEMGSAIVVFNGTLVDLGAMDSLNPGTSTVYFENSAPLTFKPHVSGRMNIIQIQSTDTVKLVGNGLTITNYLYVKTGMLHLGDALVHNIFRITYVAPNTGSISFGSSRCLVTGNNADFRGIKPYADSGSSLEFVYLLGNTTFRPYRGAKFPSLVVNIPLRTLVVGSYAFNAGDLRLLAGTLDLGVFRDTVSSVSGSGNLIFRANTMLSITGDTADFSSMSSIVSGPGIINFLPNGRVQTIIPKDGALHPALVSTGGSIVRLGGTTINTIGYTQSGGTLDMNGCNLTVSSNGSFTLSNGTDSSLKNLSGRTITVEGNCALNGTALKLLTVLSPSKWNLAVSGALSANFAVFKNCSASVTPGIAMNSVDSTGNDNWSFLSGKKWTGASGSNLWSDALNWDDSTTPGVTDTLIFDNTSAASCTLDVSDTVASVVFTAGYTGVFNFQEKSLTLSANADFRSAGPILSDVGSKLRFIGGGTRILIPRIGNTPLPSIEQYGTGQTRIAVNPLRAGQLDVYDGLFHMGSSLKDTFEAISGYGSIDFGSALVSVNGLNADFSSLTNLTPGSGTLQFIGNNVTQNFRPASVATLPSVVIRNAGTGAVLLQASLRANALTVVSGTLYLGSALTHSVTSIIGNTAGTINFGSSTLQVAGTVDFRNPNVNAASGTLEFNGTAGQLFYTKTGQYYPMLIQSGAGAVTLVNNLSLNAKGLNVYGSRFNFNNRQHIIDTLFGTGVIYLASSTIMTSAKHLDLTQFSQLIPGTGNIEFTATAGVQTVIPRTNTVNPGFFHSGNGTLKFSGSDFNMNRFLQTAGILDFNGINPSVINSGYFTIQNGDNSSVTNLGGRTITVQGNATLSGSGSNILNLKSITPWYLAVTGSITAEFSVISNCTSSISTGIAINSTDSGGNFNWSFAESRVWDGEGLDNNWSNPVNWSGDQIPLPSEIALFNITSTKNCVLDQNIIIGHIIFRSGYVGTFSFNTYTLSVSGNCDFANAGAVIPGSGTLRFTGNAPQTFVPRAGGAIFPKIVVEATNITTITTQSLTVNDIEMRSGTLNFGSGLTHNIYNSITSTGGSLNFGGASVNMYGKTFNVSLIDSIIPNSGVVYFAAAADTQIIYPKNGQTLPGINHNGLALLKIVGSNMRALSFVQSGLNTLDFNGWNLTLTSGDMTITNGHPLSFQNLGGRTIFVQGNATLGGTAGNLLGLAPPSLWHINVKGSLTATLSYVGNSIADDATGMGVNSTPADSNNVNWFFENGVVWDGEGFDSLWSTPDNWSTNAMPNDTDIVLFSSASAKECALDINANVKRIIFLPGYTGNFHFDEQTLKVKSNADFRTGGTFTTGAGAVLDMAGTALQTLFPPSGQGLPNLLISDTGGVRLSKNALTAASINIQKGFLNLDSGFIHTAVDFSGNGKIIFNNSTLRLMGSDIQFGSINRIERGTGSLVFAAGSGTQNLIPHPTDTLPTIIHSGAASLRLNTNDLRAASFNQNAGRIDFNGRNARVAGNFALTNGNVNAVGGLSGVNITVSGTTSLAGQNGSLLNLAPASKWSIASTGALTASYAVIANCSAKVAAGVSANSRNGGGNYRWSFPAVVWDGGGANNNWSTAANWNGDVLPLPFDSVLFNTTSIKACNLDISDTVKSITFTAPYTGAYSFGSSSLTILEGSGDFRSGGNINAGTGKLVFSGSNAITQRIIPKAGTAFPSFVKRGASALNVLTNPLSVLHFNHNQGTITLNTGLTSDSFAINDSINLGTGLTHTVGNISGNGKLNFNTSTLRSNGLNCDFRNFNSVTAPNGTLRFIGTAKQSFKPKNGIMMPALIQDGIGGTIIDSSSLLSGNLTLSSGTFDLNKGFQHTVNNISGAAACTLICRNSTLKSTGTSADFSVLGKVSSDSAVLEMAGTAGQVLKYKSGSTIRKIIQNGLGGTTVQTNGLAHVDTLSILQGAFNLGNALTHNVSAISGNGTGTLHFGTSILETIGDTLNFSTLGTVTPSLGILRFLADTGDTQIVIPKAAQTLPAIQHPFGGMLKLKDAALQSISYTMIDGYFDFNGYNLTTIGNLSITNGNSNTFTNLAGRTITSGGSIILNGQNGNLININPSAPWTIAATGALSADYANIKNSNATLSEGVAANSTNSGGNLRWRFGAKVWDGGGADNNWSNSENWNGNSLPTSFDSVAFNNVTSKSCVVNIADTVGVLNMSSGYTGTLTFTAETLTVIGNADFRSGGDIAGIAANGAIALSSTSTQSLISRSLDTLPSVVKKGTGTLTVSIISMNAEALVVKQGAVQLVASINTDAIDLSGQLNLGTGLSHTVNSLAGTGGTINFGTSSISVKNDANISLLSSIIPGSGSLKFIGSAPQSLSLPADDTLPLLEQNGTGGTVVNGNLKCSLLVVTSGDFNLSAGTSHLVRGFQGAGSLTLGSSRLKITGTNADFSSLTSLSSSSASIEMSGASAQTLKPKNGIRFAKIYQNGTGGSTVTSNPLLADTLVLTSGRFNLGSALTDSIKQFTGNGHLDFGSATLVMAADTINFEQLSALTPGSGVLKLIGAKGVTQNLKAKNGSTLPLILHPDSGKLRLIDNELSAIAMTFERGILDLNGKNITLAGNFNVTGDSLSFENLGNRKVTVNGDALLGGKNGNLLNLNPSDNCTLSVAGNLTASYSRVKNCIAALSEGTGLVSTDEGGNVNWNFAGKEWVATGPDYLWSTASNWSGGALPLPTEGVIFGSSSVLSCSLDVNVTVKSVQLTPFYTGTFKFGNDTLTLSGKGRASFRSGGTYSANGGALRFTGDSAQTLEADADDLLPSVIHSGNGTLTIKNGELKAADLIVDGGITVFADSFKAAVDNLSGYGSLRLGTAAELAINGDADLSNMVSFEPKSSILKMNGSSEQTLTLSSSDSIYSLVQSGTGGTVIGGSPLKVLSDINILNGTLKLGTGLTHSASSVYGSSSGILDFESSALRLTKNGDFSDLRISKASGSSLQFTGTESCTLNVNGIDTLPALYFRNRSNTAVTGDTLRGNLVYVDSGTVYLNSSAKVYRVGVLDGKLVLSDNYGFNINSLIASGGSIYFGTNSNLTVSGDSLDLAGLDTLEDGSGTISFASGSNQLMKPLSGITHPSLRKTGAGNLTIAGMPLLTGNLYLGKGTTALSVNLTGDTLSIDSNATLNLGVGNEHAFEEFATGGEGGLLQFNSSKLILSGNADFSFTSISGDNGRLEFNGTALQNFRPRSSAQYNSFYITGSDTVSILDRAFSADTLKVVSGTLKFGSALTHSVNEQMDGSGNLVFNTSTIDYSGSVVNFNNFASIDASLGTFKFVSPLAQTVYAKINDTLPALYHTGAGKLTFAANPVKAKSISQTAGEMDFSGLNIRATDGDFIISNGNSTTVSALDGAVISASNDVSLNGQNGNLLNLDANSPWSVDAGNNLTAQYAMLKNSTASSGNGHALYTMDLGGNSGWVFGEKIWDGGGVDNKWTTKENWSGDVLPVFTDRVRLNNSSVKDLLFDTIPDVYSFVADSAYTGVLDFNGKGLILKGNLDLRSGGNIIGTGLVEFSGTVPETLYTISDTLPNLHVSGSANLIVASDSVNVKRVAISNSATLDINSKSFSISELHGLGNVYMADASVLSIHGDSADFSMFNSFNFTGNCRLNISANNALFSPVHVYPSFVKSGSGTTYIR